MISCQFRRVFLLLKFFDNLLFSIFNQWFRYLVLRPSLGNFTANIAILFIHERPSWHKFSLWLHLGFFALQRGCVLCQLWTRFFSLQLVSEIVAKTMNWWKKFKLRKRSHKLISKSLADYLLSCIKEITIGGSRVSFPYSEC